MSDKILDVPPTRMVLLQLKDQEKLAKKGHELLKKKHDALLAKFFKLVDEYRDMKRKVGEKLVPAKRKLLVAAAENGSDLLGSVARSTPSAFALTKKMGNHMGVVLFELGLETKKLEAGVDPLQSHLLGASAAEARNAFKDMLEDLIKLSELKDSISKIAEEIKLTRMRVNALEHQRIPAIQNTQKKIKDQLAEAERENFFRLKLMKGRMEEA